MVSPFEFIAGRDWSKSADVINRSLELYDKPEKRSKFLSITLSSRFLGKHLKQG